MCLDVSDASLNRETNVQAWVQNPSTVQQWSIVKTDIRYKIHSRCNSYYLDVNGATFETVTNVQLWEIKDGNDTFDVKYLGNGYYSICESISGLSLDVNNEKPDEYLNVNKNVHMHTY